MDITTKQPNLTIDIPDVLILHSTKGYNVELSRLTEEEKHHTYYYA